MLNEIDENIFEFINIKNIYSTKIIHRSIILFITFIIK